MQGVTINKVGDVQQFVYTWLEAFQQDLNVMASRIRINRLLESARAVQDPSPWPDHLEYFFHLQYARWMPILPSAGMTMIVASSTSGTTIGGVGTLPLIGGPSSGHNTTSALMTSVVGVASTPTIPDENIKMKDSVPDAEENSHPMETE